MLEFVATFSLAIHLVCMNLATAGPLVCLWCESREGRIPVAKKLGESLANASVFVLVAGIGFGFLVGWLSWSEDYHEALSFLSNRIISGLGELAFSLILMAVYAVWLAKAQGPSRWHRVWRGLFPVLAATNLMYHFPFLFIILSNSAGQTDLPDEPLQSAQFLSMISQGDVLSRATHFWLASFAVTGAFLMFFAVTRLRDESDFQQVATWGGRLALVPTLIQLPVGMWILFGTVNSAQNRLMGGDLLATSFFVVSIFGAFGLMHLLSAIAMGNVSRRGIWLSIATMFVVILLMSATSRQMRVADSVGSETHLQKANAETSLLVCLKSP